MGSCCKSIKKIDENDICKRPQSKDHNLNLESNQNKNNEIVISSQTKIRLKIRVENLKSQTDDNLKGVIKEKQLSDENQDKRIESSYKNPINQNEVSNKIYINHRKSSEPNDFKIIDDNNEFPISKLENNVEAIPNEFSILNNHLSLDKNRVSNIKECEEKSKYYLSHNSDIEDNLLHLLECKLYELRVEFFERKLVKIYFSLFLEKKFLYEDDDSYNKIKGISQEIKDLITRLFDLNKITLVEIHSNTTLQFDDYKVECNALNERDLDYYIPIFFFEFSLYPISFVRNSKLNKIYFANSLKFINYKITELRPISPNYKDLSIIYSCNERNLSIIKRVMHHEFFYFINYVDDKTQLNAENWESLNIEGFKYGSNDLDNYIKNGFLNFVSTQYIDEDKAEIFTHMFNNPCEAFEASDKIILKKVMYVDSFLRKFDPRGIGGDNFWFILTKLRKYLQTIYVS